MTVTKHLCLLTIFLFSDFTLTQQPATVQIILVNSHALLIFRSRVKKQRDLERQRAHDDRHWSKKSLEEMAERDWRILREDFTISTKGKHFHS